MFNTSKVSQIMCKIPKRELLKLKNMGLSANLTHDPKKVIFFVNSGDLDNALNKWNIQDDTPVVIFSFSRKKGFALLTVTEKFQLAPAVDEVLKDGFIDKYFSKYDIELELLFILFNSLTKREGQRDRFISLKIENFRHDIENLLHDYKYYFPLSNLRFDKKLKIGNVYFSSSVDLNPHIKQELKLNKISRNECYSVCYPEIYGTYDLAKALNEVRIALSILKFYLGPYHVPIGLKGEINENIRVETVVSDEADHLFSTKWILSNRLQDENVIDEEFIEQMINDKFEDIQRIILKRNPKDIDKRIITALYWFSEALPVKVPINIEDFGGNDFLRFGDSFIKLCTSLESLLINDKEPIVHNISERTAFLLGTDYETRKAIKRDIKYFYDIRSQFVHRGRVNLRKHEDFSPNDLNTLISAIRAVIFRVLELKTDEKLKGIQDVIEYIDKIKMS